MTNTPKPEALVEQAREWASVVREADKQWSEPMAGLLQEAATTIAALAAERDALKAALERSKQGWENILELDLMPHVHRANVQEFADEARATLERTAQP